MRSNDISTPVSLIVHSLREIYTELRRGRYFFVDIRRDGLALYELNDEPLAVPGQVTAEEAWQMASVYLNDRLPHAHNFLRVGLEKPSTISIPCKAPGDQANVGDHDPCL
jgi:uncharacterized protein